MTKLYPVHFFIKSEITRVFADIVKRLIKKTVKHLNKFCNKSYSKHILLKKNYLITCIILFLIPLSVINADPSIQQCLDSWNGFSLENVCDCWSILPDKILEINSETKKVEFNYSMQTKEDGAYIPGKEIGYMDYSRNIWVKTGQEKGSYQKVTVIYYAKVILTLKNNIIISNSYSGDTKALVHFIMEPTQFSSYVESENKAREIAFQNMKTSKQKKMSFIEFGVGYSIPDTIPLTIGFFLPAVDCPVYPSAEVFTAINCFDSSQLILGTQFFANISTGRPNPSDDGDLFLAGGFLLKYEDGDINYGFPIRAGIRFPGNIGFNYTLTIHSTGDILNTISLQLYFGI